MRSRRSRLYADIARQRILRLYHMAVSAVRDGDLEYARLLGREAWELYRSTRVRVPRYVKRGLCRRCKTPLIPGITARVRLHNQGSFSYITVTCLVCGWMRRYPYKRARSGGSSPGGTRGEPQEESEASTSRPRRRDNR